ncbi:cation diffusion facilitator family transporter [Candidatus Jidaibacter acanthamoebae]|nr:cation diffusion facilitator family transporter [Candidatus Jidaibacter acanthamoeba]
MSDIHGHTHNNYGDNINLDKNYLFKALLLTLSFMVIEIIVAFVTGSLTILSDAGHMFTDTLALGLSWYSIKLSSKKANNTFSYGYHRAQIIAALLNGITLFILSIYIIIEAIIKIQNPVELDGSILIWVGGAGFIVNLLGLYFITKASYNNINIRSALYHVLSDMFGSLAAVIAGCIIIYTQWMLIDPILSILISILFIRITWKLLTESLSILMETAPSDIDYQKLENDIKNVNSKIIDLHHIHIWSINKSKKFITLHIKVKDSSENDLIITSLEKILHNNFHIEHSTIQIENELCNNKAC